MCHPRIKKIVNARAHELRRDIEEFSYNTGLEVKKVKHVGLDGLKALIEEASKKLEN